MKEIAKGPLDSNGNELKFDQIYIRSLGIAGEVKILKPSTGETRAQTLESRVLAQALESHNIDTDYIIEIGGVTDENTTISSSSRSMAPDQKSIEMRIPSIGEKWKQLLLVTDENGIATWHLPIDDTRNVDSTRGESTVTFIIPGYAPEATPKDVSRGILGRLGKKIIRVLSFAIDDKIGKIGDYYATKWEDNRRPNTLRLITKETYRQNTVGELTMEDWRRLGEGRSLLFIHGTFSRASNAFNELTPEFIDEINKHYSGRVFAFDHKTLSEDPTDNAKFFTQSMPDSQALDVDIICHSRGGHIARILSEHQYDLPLDSKSLIVNKVIFVASPNRGTVLADPNYMSDFVDAHTNILSLLPNNVITDTLELLLVVIKQLAIGTLRGLEGLQSMNPSGEYLKGYLNTGQASTTKYHAITANFDPSKPRFKAWAQDKLMDHIFKEENDLVVPTKGVYEENGDEMFPITTNDRLIISGSGDTHHGNYFSNKNVVNQLRTWLSIS